MRLFSMILWIILIVLGVSFAVLNSQSISINYFLGPKIIYFPLLVLILLFCGALIGMIALIPFMVRLRKKRHEA